jgi:hypothetical protein
MKEMAKIEGMKILTWHEPTDRQTEGRAKSVSLTDDQIARSLKVTRNILNSYHALYPGHHPDPAGKLYKRFAEIAVAYRIKLNNNY